MDKIAVLIPCYNESKTVQKVIEDFKRELPEATIYVYDNNSKTEPMKLLKKQERLFVMKENKEKEMLSGACFVILMLSVIS